MNIFALHPDPIIAASYHCDQHLGKMILETAQMLCSVAHIKMPGPWIPYKPTHVNHPCTKWLMEHYTHIAWTIRLAQELEFERIERVEHASTEVIKLCAANLLPGIPVKEFPAPTSFIFCGPGHIGYRSSLDIHQKYQAYYREKHAAWLDTRRPMTYKNRPIPPFMVDLL